MPLEAEVIPVLLWATRAAAAFAVAATLAPAINTGAWPVRVCEFPRVQLAALCAIVLPLELWLALRSGAPVEALIVGGMVAASGLWQLRRVLPFTPLWPRELPDAPASPEESVVRVVIANVKFDNDQHREVRRALDEQHADILVLVEIDEAWARGLSRLRDRFPHRVEETRTLGRGIALWSRLPVRGAAVRETVTPTRPSIRTEVEFPDGKRVNLIALHPTPPGLPKRGLDGRHDSRVRDAELVLAGREVAREPDASWLVLGDLNDVAWSRTTRLFKSISGLLDPRVGRSMCNTFPADHPLRRFPLDHLFVSEGFEVRRFGRLRTPGSDHFAVAADLVLRRPEGVAPEPNGEELADAAELVESGREDAADDEAERRRNRPVRSDSSPESRGA